MKNYLILDKKHKNADDINKLQTRVEAHYPSVEVVNLEDVNKDRCFDEFPNRLIDNDLSNARLILETTYQLVDLDKTFDIEKRNVKQREEFASLCINFLRHKIFVSLFKYPYVSTDNIVKEYLYVNKGLEIQDDELLLNNLNDINYEMFEKTLIYRLKIFSDFLEATKNEKRISLSSSEQLIGFKKYANGETSTSVQYKPIILRLSQDFAGDKSDKELYEGENKILGRKAYYKYKKELKDAIIEQIKELHQDFNGKFDDEQTLMNISFENLDVVKGKIISPENLKRLIFEIKNS